MVIIKSTHYRGIIIKGSSGCCSGKFEGRCCWRWKQSIWFGHPWFMPIIILILFWLLKTLTKETYAKECYKILILLILILLYILNAFSYFIYVYITILCMWLSILITRLTILFQILNYRLKFLFSPWKKIRIITIKH
jgi:hypothetical protein